MYSSSLSPTLLIGVSSPLQQCRQRPMAAPYKGLVVPLVLGRQNALLRRIRRSRKRLPSRRERLLRASRDMAQKVMMPPPDPNNAKGERPLKTILSKEPATKEHLRLEAAKRPEAPLTPSKKEQISRLRELQHIPSSSRLHQQVTPASQEPKQLRSLMLRHQDLAQQSVIRMISQQLLILLAQRLTPPLLLVMPLSC